MFKDINGYESISYDRLSVILIEVVKKQKMQIEQRHKLIDEQKKRFRKTEKRNKYN